MTAKACEGGRSSFLVLVQGRSLLEPATTSFFFFKAEEWGQEEWGHI
jgi:hypothetical protein